VWLRVRAHTANLAGLARHPQLLAVWLRIRTHAAKSWN
jgi:hypothetical protein